MIFGPDVSDWQGSVDWGAVRASGRLFGFAKATEGTGYVADTLARNRAGMAQAGLVLRGLYHFARPDRNHPEAEADHFLAVVGELAPGEVAVLDLESGNIGQAETGAWALRWLRAVEDFTGRTPWLYSYAPFLAAIDTSALTRYPLWIAGYGRNDGQVPSKAYRPSTDRWAQAVLWQYTSAGAVPGIGGQADDNVFEGTEAELVALAGGAAPVSDVAGLEHLHPVWADRVAAACRQYGTTVYSGARSTERQAELSACYQQWLIDRVCHCAGGCNPANRPGTSWHEYGANLAGGQYALAVDFAEPYPHGAPGIIFPIPGEPWHGQPTEIPETSRVAGADQRLPAQPTGDDMFTPSPRATRHLVAAHSGLLLTATGNHHGAAVVQRPADGSLAQRWELWGHEDGTCSFVCRWEGDTPLALDRPDYSLEPGTQLQVARCEFNDAQRWTLDRLYGLGHVWATPSGTGSNLAMDVAGLAMDEGPVIIWPGNDQPNQQWLLVHTV